MLQYQKTVELICKKNAKQTVIPLKPKLLTSAVNNFGGCKKWSQKKVFNNYLAFVIIILRYSTGP